MVHPACRAQLEPAPDQLGQSSSTQAATHQRESRGLRRQPPRYAGTEPTPSGGTKLAPALGRLRRAFRVGISVAVRQPRLAAPAPEMRGDSTARSGGPGLAPAPGRLDRASCAQVATYQRDSGRQPHRRAGRRVTGRAARYLGPPAFPADAQPSRPSGRGVRRRRARARPPDSPPGGKGAYPPAARRRRPAGRLTASRPAFPAGGGRG